MALPSCTCPYCSYPLLMHVSKGKPYWFCHRCHSDVPYGIDQPAAPPPRPAPEPLPAPPANQPETTASSITLHRELQDQLQNVKQLKQDFLNATSQELLTPLSNMRLSLQILNSLLIQPDSGKSDETPATEELIKVAHYLNVLNQECDREIKRISDLIALQQLEAETQPILPIQLALGDWLNQITASFEDAIRREGRSLQIDLPDSLPPLNTDPTLLKRVLTELLDNACQFTPAGETITIQVMAQNGKVQIGIGNSGIEIPDEALTQVFDQFYRLPNHEPQRRLGMGLGLCLARRLVLHLGGVIWAESGMGQTWFMVELPFRESDTPSQLDLLMSYVAYYLSRGRKVISPLSNTLPFEGEVYGYWGYHRDFLDYWRRLQQRRDFHDLYLEGDTDSFGQFVSGSCTVGECARCRLPIPLNLTGIPRPTCPCDQNEPLQLLQSNEGTVQVLAVGTPTDAIEILQMWFSSNGFEVTFVDSPAAIAPHSLPLGIDLVLIQTDLSEETAKDWAEQLQQHFQLQGAPIVGLSAQNQFSLLWTDRHLDIKDYLLAPLGGQRLAAQLRKRFFCPGSNTASEIHWFPK